MFINTQRIIKELYMRLKIVCILLISILIGACGATNNAHNPRPSINIPKWMPTVPKHRIPIFEEKGVFITKTIDQLYKINLLGELSSCPPSTNLIVTYRDESSLYTVDFLDKIKDSLSKFCNLRGEPKDRGQRIRIDLEMLEQGTRWPFGAIELYRNRFGHKWTTKIKRMDDTEAEKLGIQKDEKELDYLVLGDPVFIARAEKFFGFKISKHRIRGEENPSNKKKDWFLMITDIEPNSLAAKAGLKEGEYLTGIQKDRIYDRRGTFQKALSDYVEGKISGEVSFVIAWPKTSVVGRGSPYWFLEKKVWVEKRPNINGELAKLAILEGDNYQGFVTQKNNVFVFDFSTDLKIFNVLFERLKEAGRPRDILSHKDRQTIKKYCVKLAKVNNNQLCKFNFSTSNTPSKTITIYTLPVLNDSLHWFELDNNETLDFVVSLPPTMKLLQNIKNKNSKSLILNKEYDDTLNLMSFWFPEKYAKRCRSLIKDLVSISGTIKEVTTENFQSTVTGEVKYHYPVEREFYNIARKSHDKYMGYSVLARMALSDMHGAVESGINQLITTYGCDSVEVQNVRSYLLSRP